MNSMSLSEVIHGFRHGLGFGHNRDQAMHMGFFVTVKDPNVLDDLHPEHRIVQVLYVLDDMEFNGQKGLMPVVLWHVSPESISFTDIPSWEVIDDRTIHSEHSVDARMDTLVSSLIVRYCRRNHDIEMTTREIKFFVAGIPRIVRHRGFKLSPNRSICKVSF